MDPILGNYFNRFKTTFEITTASTSPEAATREANEKQNESKAFERFVNYVMFSLDDPDVFTSDSDLLETVSIGGAQDTAIDGLGIRINGHLIGTTAELTLVAESSKKLSVEFIFIQSKNKGGLDIGEFVKFSAGIRNFLSEGFLPENEKLLELREVKHQILSDQRIISKLEKLPSLFVYYVTVGAEIDDSNFDGMRRMLESDLKQGYYDSIAIKSIGGQQLARFCRELENKFEKSININDIFPLIVKDQENVAKAYAFTCSAREFLRLLEKDDGQLRRSLFNDNVRDYLGNRGSINHEIEQTILDSPEMFLLRNNGVTIVCSDFKQVRDKLVTFENPQIVNGCQTSNSIFRLRDNSNIDQVQILVRVISTNDLAVSNSIVRGTNKQNQVLDEAFEATLPFHQEQLEPFFLASGQATDKIYYERRSKQYNDDPLIRRSQIVNLRILTQTFVSIIMERPHESFRHEAKLLESYAGAAENRKIFRDDHDPNLYYICAMVWKAVDHALRNGQIEPSYRVYRQHLCYTLCRSIDRPPRSLKPSKGVTQYCDRIKAALAEPDFGASVANAVDLFESAMKRWLQLGKSRFGIKDSREFTEILQSQFDQRQPSQASREAEVPNVLYGTILRMIWREDGHWFGFITRGPDFENTYFDKRSFAGDLGKLVPGVDVEFELGTGSRARRVSV